MEDSTFMSRNSNGHLGSRRIIELILAIKDTLYTLVEVNVETVGKGVDHLRVPINDDHMVSEKINFKLLQHHTSLHSLVPIILWMTCRSVVTDQC
jgi:hypothetical protein